MKYLIFFALSFLPLASSFAAKPTDQIIVDKNLPLELDLLITSLHTLELTSSERQMFKRDLSKLDSSLKSIHSEDIHLLTKSYFYRSLLGAKKHNKEMDPKIINLENSSKLQQKIKDKKILPLASWLLDSLLNDIYQLGDLKRESNLSNGQKNLILPWYQFFLTSDEDQINTTFKGLGLKLLTAYEKHISLLHLYSKNKKPSNPPSTFFKTVKLAPETPEKTINDIIEETQIPDEPIQKIADAQWKPKDSEAEEVSSSKNIILKPDPNYKSPAKLPTPVNDW
jgi:hypothetical protein